MTCPSCKQPMIGVQYVMTTEDYDGISEWRCESYDGTTGCKLRIGRWSGKRLADGEIEPRYGRERGASR